MAFDFSRSIIGLVPPMAREAESPAAVRDSLFGISPGMRGEMDLASNRGSQTARLLMQNPLFASDPQAMAELANASSVGYTPNPAAYITPEIGRRLNAMDRLQALMEREQEAKTTRAEAETGARRLGLGGQGLTPIQQELLGIRMPKENPEWTAVRNWMQGRANPQETEFVEGHFRRLKLDEEAKQALIDLRERGAGAPYPEPRPNPEVKRQQTTVDHLLKDLRVAVNDARLQTQGVMGDARQKTLARHEGDINTLLGSVPRALWLGNPEVQNLLQEFQKMRDQPQERGWFGRLIQGGTQGGGPLSYAPAGAFPGVGGLSVANRFLEGFRDLTGGRK